MKMPSKIAIVFNGAALLLVAGSLTAIVRSLFVKESVTVCSERYATGTRFALDNGGAALSPADLQARLGGSDWALMEKARIVSAKSGPASHALELALAQPSDSAVKPGVGFNWSPRALGKVDAACLAYSVLLPEGFDFGKEGRLPGLMGGDAAGEKPVFSTRYAWRETGAGDLHTHLPGATEGRSIGNERGGFAFPRGRWLALEQEVVLNAPGQKNGIVRIWVDGALKFEKTNVVLRETASTHINGVLAEVVALGAARSAKSQTVSLSPFELRWQ